MFQFCSCISGKKVPLDFGLTVVPVILPRGDVALHYFQIGNSPIQALSIQGAELDFCHVEPTAMLGRIMDFEAFCQPPGLFRFKRLVEGGKAVGVQVIQDQAHSDGVWIAFVEQRKPNLFGLIRLFKSRLFSLPSFYSIRLRKWKPARFLGW